MSEPFRIFIGYDAKEPIAYHVLAHSILRRARRPVSIAPLCQVALRNIGLYRRERGPTESTEFSLTRFLVPYLCGFRGFALFLDCDMLALDDVTSLMLYPMAYPGKAVYVAQHEYTPKEATKFLGQQQTAYPRKNWSSVMLFDCSQCRALTPEIVNYATGLDLHRFHWLRECVEATTFQSAAAGKKEFLFTGPKDAELEDIGSLPLEWNWLVGEYEKRWTAKLLHYTLGGPWFDDTANCDYADMWREERDHMLSVGVAA